MLIRSGDIRDQFESCQKSRRNLDVFWPSQILGLTFQKWYPHYHPSLEAHGLEKFREGTPTSREVIEAYTLDFRPNFKFLQIFFLGGTPIPVVVCAI